MSRSLDLVVNPRLSAFSSNFCNGTSIYNTDKTANRVKFDKDISPEKCLRNLKKIYTYLIRSLPKTTKSSIYFVNQIIYQQVLNMKRTERRGKFSSFLYIRRNNINIFLFKHVQCTVYVPFVLN